MAVGIEGAASLTDASAHDSQAFDDLLNKGNTSSDVYADSAYRSAETERKLKGGGAGAASTSADAAIVR